MNKDQKKQRGIFLNLMILLLIIGDLQIPYYLLNPRRVKNGIWQHSFMVSDLCRLGLISNIAIIIGMWKMKKVGAIYVLAAYFVSKILVDLAYILPDRQIAVFATTAIGAVLWFWAIYRKRSSFDRIIGSRAITTQNT
jgi:hypothetical protein